MRGALLVPFFLACGVQPVEVSAPFVVGAGQIRAQAVSALTPEQVDRFQGELPEVWPPEEPRLQLDALVVASARVDFPASGVLTKDMKSLRLKSVRVGGFRCADAKKGCEGCTPDYTLTHPVARLELFAGPDSALNVEDEGTLRVARSPAPGVGEWVDMPLDLGALAQMHGLLRGGVFSLILRATVPVDTADLAVRPGGEAPYLVCMELDIVR
jgi:hypothetical protein